MIGVPIAFILFKTNIPFPNFFKIAFALVLVIPTYILAISWINMVGPEGHIIDYIIFFTGPNNQYFSIYGFWGSFLILSLSSVPFVILLTGGALNSIDDSILEAADLSVGFRKTFTRVILPLASNGIMFGSLLVFIKAISDFGTVSFLLYDTFSIEIFSQLAAFYDAKSAMIYSIILISTSFIAVLILLKIFKTRIFTSILSSSSTKKYDLGSWWIPAFLSTIFILTLSLFIPLSSLFYSSLFFYGKYNGFGNYLTTFDIAMPNIVNSIKYAVFGSFVTLIIGFSIAYGLFHSKKVSNRPIELVLFIPFILPGTLLGLGLILFWNHPLLFIYNTPIMILFGYISKFTIIAFKTSEIALSKINKSIEEAAVQVEKRQYLILKNIIFPLIRPPLLTGWLLIYILCLNELNTSIMVYPPGYATLPISIFILYHDGPPGLVAALSMTLIIICLIPLLIIFLILKLSEIKRS